MAMSEIYGGKWIAWTITSDSINEFVSDLQECLHLETGEHTPWSLCGSEWNYAETFKYKDFEHAFGVDRVGKDSKRVRWNWTRKSEKNKKASNDVSRVPYNSQLQELNQSVFCKPRAVQYTSFDNESSSHKEERES